MMKFIKYCNDWTVEVFERNRQAWNWSEDFSID